MHLLPTGVEGGRQANWFGAHRPNIKSTNTTLFFHTMAEERAAHHLLNVLEERGLDAQLNLDNVLAAFEDDHIKQEAAVWVEEYLHEDTLLNKEELEL